MCPGGRGWSMRSWALPVILVRKSACVDSARLWVGLRPERSFHLVTRQVHFLVAECRDVQTVFTAVPQGSLEDGGCDQVSASSS